MEIEYNNPQPRSQLYLKSRNGYDDVLQCAAPTLPLSPLTATQPHRISGGHRHHLCHHLPQRHAVLHGHGPEQHRPRDSEQVLHVSGKHRRTGALRAKVAVANPEAVPITWTSSNTDAAVVDANGNVTAVATVRP